MIGLQKGNYLGRVNYYKDVNGIIASVTSYPDIPFAESLHYHETFHLSLILQGGNLERRKTRNIERFPGMITYCDAGEAHQSSGVLAGSYHVNLEITDQFIKTHDLHIDASVLEKGNSADDRFLMLKIYKELLLDDQDSLLGIESALLHLLQFELKNDSRTGTPDWVFKIKEALHDGWNENLTLCDLAVIANLHPANLSGYFPKYFGCTIGEFRRKVKIEKALELLKFQDVPLTEIAYDCGFADQSHFTRTCKQLTGWNPKKLKQIYSQINTLH
jgi:AraC family transcriptional regulator